MIIITMNSIRYRENSSKSRQTFSEHHRTLVTKTDTYTTFTPNKEGESIFLDKTFKPCFGNWTTEKKISTYWE